MERLKPFIYFLLLSAVIYGCVQVTLLERQKQVFKTDLVELSNIQYGLFNVDEWKQILARIITSKIEEFDLEEIDRDALHAQISGFLLEVLDDFEQRYYAERSGSIEGFLQGAVATLTGTFKQLRKDIPTFTDQIIDFLGDDASREAVSSYLIEKMDEFSQQTFSKTDYALVNEIVEKYEKGTVPETKLYLEEGIGENASESRPYKIILVVLSVFIAVFLLIGKNFANSTFLFLTLTCMVLLATGVLIPMIEIDARISQLEFTLLGESVSFTDQVLYYRSKSILQIVDVMLFQKRLDLVGVGILVLSFSVLFPVMKLVSSLLFLYRKNLRTNPFIRTMVFRTGKWSMADVMVVAIFMAYIGFDGIISDQLSQLEDLSSNLRILTTNQSELLFGFFCFTGFVLLSLLLTGRLQRLEK